MDPPPLDNERKKIWRVATFHCRCQTNSIPHQYGHQSFCKVCQHLIHKGNMLHPTTCLTCGMNDSWEILGQPCLACLIAAIMYRNPFHARFQKQLEQFLSSHDLESDDTFGEQRQPRPHGHFRKPNETGELKKTSGRSSSKHQQSILDLFLHTLHLF
jgi:hypothetical protein